MKTRHPLLRLVLPLALALPCLARRPGVASAAASPSGHATLRDGRADAIFGDWKPEEQDVVVHIARVDGAITGTIVKAGDASRVGKVIMRGIAYDASTDRWKGEVYALRRSAFVPASIRLASDGEFILTGGSGAMTKDVSWRRQ